jgi:catechol 2,3-dioxygenase
VIRVERLGHVMLKVRSLGRSLAFYQGLGLREVARRDFGEGMTVFLSAGATHHDIALVEAATPAGRRLSLAKRALEAAGTPILMALDHRVSQGLYVPDPDGNLIELYVDACEALWRADPSLVANSELLSL